LYPLKLGEFAVIKLTIDEFTQQVAWRLGHDDYPAVDRCSYDCGKNPILCMGHTGTAGTTPPPPNGAYLRLGGKTDRAEDSVRIGLEGLLAQPDAVLRPATTRVRFSRVYEP
jgi:hypothetical protein